MCVQACVWICLGACDCGPVPLSATVPQLILHRSSAGCYTWPTNTQHLCLGLGKTKCSLWPFSTIFRLEIQLVIGEMLYLKPYFCNNKANRFCLKAQKCVLAIVTAVECLTFSVQNGVCVEFDTRRLISKSSAAGKVSPCPP